MVQYIDKAALVAEIKERIETYNKGYANGDDRRADALEILLHDLDTIEVKEVEEKFEHPNIKVKDAIEVSSRMKYVDEDLKPIADFIMNYASWNLHEDEWNQPVLEVPLFRVLDALVQRGKPYCCAG